MPFEEIPLSELEALVFIQCTGGQWSNFDEIEEALTLDELLLLIDTIHTRDKNQFKANAALQGIQIDDMDDQPDNPLPEEVRIMEEKFQIDKARREAEVGQKIPNPFSDIGLGYAQI